MIARDENVETKSVEFRLSALRDDTQLTHQRGANRSIFVARLILTRINFRATRGVSCQYGWF